ncbi:MAG: HAMP domain-containing protein [Deltaproteobacteria bacterium]|nr:HAMP domain-containing protein [Deltaproteobacteria bacterium]
MSIRAYLIFSYVVLILLLSLGMWAVDEFVVERMEASNIAFAEEGVMEITTANYQLAKQILTSYGEAVVEDKAEDMVRELGYLLKGKKRFDYSQMRRDKVLRDLCTQEIRSRHGVAGYLDLIDNKGYAVLHPNRAVEGKNFQVWQEQYPKMWELVRQSFSQPRVKGYYTFMDTQNRIREKFMVLQQVPGTPFIAVAAVNIDDFFLPVVSRIRQASQEVVANAKVQIKDHAAKVDYQVKAAGLVGGLVFILLALLSAFYFAHAISRPILHLRRGVEQVGEGNFAVTVPERGAREVIHLAHSFNRLGERLTDYIAKRDFIRDTFGRYVTMEVVKKLLEDESALEMGGETREVSILMSDIRGFTALTAGMAPEDVITFLNRYLSKMIEILVDYHAVIDEIVGDGILAFFGAPELQEDHAVRAVACALEMQAAMEEINRANKADGLPHLEMGVAVNTGQVVVGNIGSEKRAKYSVVGAHVNFTSRIESYALGGQVLISEDTYREVKDVVTVRDTLKAEMKGVPDPATLYEIGGMTGPYSITLPEKLDILTPLPEKLPIHLYRIHEKIVAGATEGAWITHICETGAAIGYEGDLLEWEDVKIHLLDKEGREETGKIYGKVTAVQTGPGGGHEAAIRFTSVPPETAQKIRGLMGIGMGEGMEG